MIFRLVLGITFLILSTATANAALVFTANGVNVTTGSTDLSLAVSGDVIQLDVDLTNTDGDAFSAIEAGAQLSDVAGLTFVGGKAVGATLSSYSLFSGSFDQYGGGIQNQTAGTYDGDSGALNNRGTNSLTIADQTGPTVKWFGGITTQSPSPNQDGGGDLGVQGLGLANLQAAAEPGGCTGCDPGSVTASLIFTFNSETEVEIGAGLVGLGTINDGGGNNVTGEVTNAFIVVPEPSKLLTSLAAMTSVFAVVGVRRRS